MFPPPLTPPLFLNLLLLFELPPLHLSVHFQMSWRMIIWTWLIHIPLLSCLNVSDRWKKCVVCDYAIILTFYVKQSPVKTPCVWIVPRAFDGKCVVCDFAINLTFYVKQSPLKTPCVWIVPRTLGLLHRHHSSSFFPSLHVQTSLLMFSTFFELQLNLGKKFTITRISD